MRINNIYCMTEVTPLITIYIYIYILRVLWDTRQGNKFRNKKKGLNNGYQIYNNVVSSPGKCLDSLHRSLGPVDWKDGVESKYRQSIEPQQEVVCALQV